MENNLLDFKTKLEETRKHDSYNKELYGKERYNVLDHLLNTHNFYLCYRTNYHQLVFNNYPKVLISLDEEDIKYFESKYLPGLQEEMEAKINKIKREYGK